MESPLSSGRVIGFDQGHGHSNLNRLDFSSGIGSSGGNTFMARAASKSPFLLFGLWCWIFSSSACLAEDHLESLNQRIYKLYAEGKYQEAIPLAEKAVEIARHVRGPEHPVTA